MKEFFTKLVRSKFSPLYLIAFIALLYFLQEKVIVPLVMGIVKSDLFFEPESKEVEEIGKIDGKTARTGFALTFCKDAVKDDGDLPQNVEFVDDKYEAWALGNRHYLIRSVVRMADPSKGAVEKQYACKIRLIGDDESKAESWSVQGLDLNAATEGN